jgi:hypothetical protein
MPKVGLNDRNGGTKDQIEGSNSGSLRNRINLVVEEIDKGRNIRGMSNAQGGEVMEYTGDKIGNFKS